MSTDPAAPASAGSLLALVYAAGIALGLLLAVLLWTHADGNRRANRWLAAALASLALLTFGTLTEDTGLVLQVPHLGHVTDWLIFVVGPCVWLYTCRLTGVDGPWGKRLAVHFFPAVALILVLVPFYGLPAAEKARLLRADLTAPPGRPNVLLLVAAVQILAYWLLALLRLKRHAQALKAARSSIEGLTFRWLRTMLRVCLALWVVWVAGTVLALPWARVPNALSVPLAMYVLGFLGLRQPAVFGAGRLAPPPPPVPAKYQRSALDPEQLEAFADRLEAVMQAEKPWLESELTLPDLAQRAGMTPHQLSQLLNARLGVTFFDYVNARRVAEVQRCLADPAYAGEPILQIALASGFNSKSAFNAAFRQHTGTTPSEYRRGVRSDAAA